MNWRIGVEPRSDSTGKPSMKAIALVIPNYAKEELRAELASVFLMAERGIPHNPDSHAAYLGSLAEKMASSPFFQ